MKRFAIISALLIVCASPLFARVDDDVQPIELDAQFRDIVATLRVEPSSAEVGMPIQLFLSVSGEAASRAVFPDFEETFGSFDVRSITPLQSKALGPNARALRIELVGYEAGEHELPSIQIETDGRTLDLGTDEPVKVEVLSLVGTEASPEEFHDIRNAISVPLAIPGIGWWVLLGVLATGGAVILVWWLLSRSKSQQPQVPVDVWAEGKLDALEAKRLPDQGRIQAFFFELTDIARSFIERRYDIDAPDRTTQEFIAESQRHQDLDPEHATLLGRMLRSADMVKFAGDRPAQAECQRSMEFVRRFVRESGPKPELNSDTNESADLDTIPMGQPERMQALGLQGQSEFDDTLTGRSSR